jgi:hypothetical protein
MASLSFIRASKLAHLLTTADPKKTMYVRVLTSTRLALGEDPLNPSAIVDLARESVGPYAVASPSQAQSQNGHHVDPAPQQVDPAPQQMAAIRSSRRSGEYWFELNGKRTDCISLKELLAGGLLALEAAKPGTLEKLSHVKPRSRRIVSRDPTQLFDKVHLAKDYAEKLGHDGWFYGTNNSANETNAWLERACTIAGFKSREEFKTSLSVARAMTLDEIIKAL